MGAVLRHIRAATGMSQSTVGTLVGLAQSHVSALERGRRRVTSLELYERMAVGLGVPRSLLGLSATADIAAHGGASNGGPGGATPTSAPESDGVADVGGAGRRAVLRVLGLTASSVGMAADDVRDLLDDGSPSNAIDPMAVRAYGEVLHRAANLGPPVRPGDVQPVVDAVLDRLVEAQQVGVPAALDRRVGQLVSDAACFAGWLRYDGGRAGAVRSYFGLARDAAHEAGDQTRSALTLASLAITWSPAVDGGSGDARRSLVMLEQAAAALTALPPHRAAAWVSANAAACAARLGAPETFRVHRERAAALASRSVEPSDGLWHGFPPRSAEDDWLDDYFSRGLVRLGDPLAEDTVRGIAESSQHRHRTADAHALLMDLYVGTGAYDAAADAGLRALLTARDAGLGRQRRRIVGLRSLAPRDEPAFTALDAALDVRWLPPVMSAATGGR